MPDTLDLQPSVLALGGSDSVNVAIGAVHSSTYIGARWTLRRVLDAEVARTQSHAYVHPSSRTDFREAERQLDLYGLIIIEGKRDTGRNTDAIRLLAGGTTGVGTPAPDIIEIRPGWDEPNTHDLPELSGHQFILDLTDEGLVTEYFARELIEYSGRLKLRDSTMVIVTTPEVWRTARPILDARTFSFAPRGHEDLIKHHFNAAGVLELAGCVSHPSVRAYVTRPERDRSGPRPTVAAAEKLVQIHRVKGRVEDSDIRAVIDEAESWREFIHRHLDESLVGAADKRIFHIAAAVLNGAPSGIVDEANQLLRVRLGHDRVPLYRALETEGWTARVKAIDAVVVDDRVWVDHVRPGLDLAIVEWLWRDHPALRKQILTWFRSLLTNRTTTAYADRIVDVLIHLAAKVHSQELVSEIHSWFKETKERERTRLRDSAIAVLGRLLLDEAMGRMVQRRLWRWATSDSAELTVPLAALCGGEYGRTYPYSALVRLKQLAMRCDGSGRDAVIGTLRELCFPGDGMRIVLEAVSSWAQDRDSRAAAIGVEALLSPLGPASPTTALLAYAQENAAAAAMLTKCWTLLVTSEHQSLATITRSWSDMIALKEVDPLLVMRIWKEIAKSEIAKATAGDSVFFGSMSVATQRDLVLFLWPHRAVTSPKDPATGPGMAVDSADDEPSPEAPQAFSPRFGRPEFTDGETDSD